MKKVVLTIKDDICVKNGKDPNATDLLNVMSHYGTVEAFESAFAREKAEYETTINSLTSQIKAIEEKGLTADEFKLIKCLREIETAITAEKDAQIKQRDIIFAELKAQYDQTVEKIKAIIG